MLSPLKKLIPAEYRPRLRRWLYPQGHWCRVVMNREIDRFIRGLNPPSLDTLEISGRDAYKYGFRSYRNAYYPEYDACKGPLDATFDLIIAQQVFEHVLRPDLAAASVYAMLRPGGTFIISTPFLLKVHGDPSDLYRWTEHGLQQMLETAGFTNVRTGSWGNRKCLAADMTADMNWTWYIPGLHSLRNEPQFPVVVWAFANREK